MSGPRAAADGDRATLPGIRAAMSPPALPADIQLRPATAADQAAIRAIIREAGINPLSLKWPNFLLAVDAADGQVVATGQVKTHGDGSRELASIATRPAYRGRGIAAEIVRRLIERHTAGSSEPLYLTCVPDMTAFYVPFGFSVVSADRMPPYFRRLERLAGAFRRLTGREPAFRVMIRDHEPQTPR